MMVLAQINGNLFGFLPEPLGMLIFGVEVVVFAIVLRRVFERGNDVAENSFSAKPLKAPRKSLKEKLS